MTGLVYTERLDASQIIGLRALMLMLRLVCVALILWISISVQVEPPSVLSGH